LQRWQSAATATGITFRNNTKKSNTKSFRKNTTHLIHKTCVDGIVALIISGDINAANRKAWRAKRETELQLWRCAKGALGAGTHRIR
jgi:hypothetical protein